MKDLRLIGRDLSKTLIIDNIEENFSLTTPENGIHIVDFFGGFEDEELPKLKNFLLKLAINQLEDIRPVLVDYKNRYEEY